MKVMSIDQTMSDISTVTLQPIEKPPSFGGGLVPAQGIPGVRVKKSLLFPQRCVLLGRAVSVIGVDEGVGLPVLGDSDIALSYTLARLFPSDLDVPFADTNNRCCIDVRSTRNRIILAVELCLKDE